MSEENSTNLAPQIDVSDVVDILVNMFGEVLDRGAIAAVVESYNGDLDQSAEALLKISEDGQALRPVEPNMPIYPTLIQPQLSQQDPTNRSYALVSKEPASSSTNPITTPKNDGLGSYEFSVWTDQIKKIVTYHNKGYRTLILMRGAPGAGKTYMSNTIVEIIGIDRRSHVFSADDYFQKKSGYDFNPMYLEVAHKSAKTRAYQALKDGISPVIIDNTNTQLWEMEPYICEAVKHGYIIELVEPATKWARNAYLLSARNTHGVTLQKVQTMLDRFEYNLTGDRAISRLRLCYPRDKYPPIIRNFPKFEPMVEKPETKRVSVKLTAEPVNCKKKEEVTLETPKETRFVTPNQESDETINIGQIELPKVQLTPNKGNINQIDEKNQLTSNTDNLNQLVEQSEILENMSKDLLNQNQYLNKISEQNISLDSASSKVLQESDSTNSENKVLAEWDSNETWLEETIAKKETHNDTTPKYQRMPKKTITKCESPFNTMQHDIQDWQSFTSYLPPWNLDMPLTTRTTPKKIKITKSECTNTEAGDSNTYTTKFKVLNTECREINQYHLPESETAIPDVRTLDKSTMTLEPNFFNERNYRCKNEENHFMAIRSMFKTIAKSDLRDIFDNCKGDPNWTVDCILDSVNTNIIQSNCEEVSDSEDVVDEPCDCVSKYQIIPYVAPAEEDKIESVAEDSIKSTKSVPVSNRKKQRRSKRERTVSETLMQKQLEERVSISGAHYSQHTLKLRNDRRGQGSLDNLSTLSFTKEMNNKDLSPSEQTPESASPIASENTSEIHDSENDVYAMSESDNEISCENEEIEIDYNSGEKTVSVGFELIKNLDKLFNRETVYPEEIVPLITMPMTLLKEMYALWIESFTHQLATQEKYDEILMKEDEEFARQLAAKEEEMAREGREPEVPDFKEIMDMDLALSIYQKETADWRTKESNDLASIMTRDKLYNLFPDMSKDVLSEMLMAHDNKFKDTVEVLLMSTGQGAILQGKNGLNKFIMEGEMARQNRILEEQKLQQENKQWPVQTVIPGNGEEFTLAMVFKYRERAQQHLRMRNHYVQKAQNSLRNESTGIAHYYSGVATYHKKQFEYSNHLAATALIQVHAQTTEYTTLDLHYMYVSEAVEAMDLFVDHHIQQVRASRRGRREHVFIVTGRGIHSNGKPKIKPAAKNRLKQRGFDIVELNPGLLAVELRSSSKLTNELSEENRRK